MQLGGTDGRDFPDGSRKTDYIYLAQVDSYKYPAFK